MRRELRETYRTAGAAGFKDAKAELTLRSLWRDYKENNSRAINGIRDARLNVLVALLEMGNFIKLMGQEKDTRTLALMGASAMGMTALLLDAIAEPIKRANGSLSREWVSYQRFKLVGGLLSAGASLIVAVDDLFTMKGKIKGHKYGLAALYFFKAAFGGISGGTTLLTMFTYAAPYIARVTGRVIAAEGVSEIAAGFIGRRILFMSVGGWLTLIPILIQVGIWMATDNPLQEWCAKCAFGDETDDERYDNMKKQYAALEALFSEPTPEYAPPAINFPPNWPEGVFGGRG